MGKTACRTDGDRHFSVGGNNRNEPERDGLSRLIAASEVKLVSAATIVEASIVLLGQFGARIERELDLLTADLSIRTVELSIEHVFLARAAFAAYGKGRHPAGLNFGDCFSYALAKHTGEMLLAKENDFARTDLSLLA